MYYWSFPPPPPFSFVVLVSALACVCVICVRAREYVGRACVSEFELEGVCEGVCVGGGGGGESLLECFDVMIVYAHKMPPRVPCEKIGLLCTSDGSKLHSKLVNIYCTFCNNDIFATELGVLVHYY